MTKISKADMRRAMENSRQKLKGHTLSEILDRNFAVIEDIIGQRADWAIVSDALAALGITDSDGNAYAETTIRQNWYRVRQRRQNAIKRNADTLKANKTPRPDPQAQQESLPAEQKKFSEDHPQHSEDLSKPKSLFNQRKSILNSR
ncbi:hypothetical protein [Brytella acorum]|uniref:hypothetical protein n=1 Tax=Brytella acorum TaxID=2959299 RepID=UPI0025ADB028|nr:hypothetical protein [Brytella acorum]MDF3626174.1 hypothetical protein [Brytella acorum]